MKSKTTELLESERRTKTWTNAERKVWLISLFFGTAALYASRAVMPLCIVAISKEMNWDKMQSGAVLSAFFWGYASTQVLGGYLSDKLSGDIVLLTGAIGWGLITFWTPPLVSLFGGSTWMLFLIMCTRVAVGCFQGVHFPALASYLASRVADDQRTASFSITASGCHIGTLITGSIGSLLLEYYGWTCPFYAIGLLSMTWVIVTRYYIISHDRRKAILSMQGNISSSVTPMLPSSSVPWLILFKSVAFWSLLIGHFCNTMAYFLLLSWLPTYFQENFVGAKGWVFNVVPWLVTLPSSIASGIIADRLIASGWNITLVRKLMETIALGGLGICLIAVTFFKSYEATLFVFALALFVNGFHNAGILTNPQDIAPKHAGSVFGLMNTAGAIPGFIGVYLTGHVLQVTKSWNLIFISSSFVCFFGWFVFTLFGTAKKIVS